VFPHERLPDVKAEKLFSGKRLLAEETPSKLEMMEKEMGIRI
jgi:hypothetical protein